MCLSGTNHTTKAVHTHTDIIASYFSCWSKQLKCLYAWSSLVHFHLYMITHITIFVMLCGKLLLKKEDLSFETRDKFKWDCFKLPEDTMCSVSSGQEMQPNQLHVFVWLDLLSELSISQQLLHHCSLPLLLGDARMIKVYWIIHHCANLAQNTQTYMYQKHSRWFWSYKNTNSGGLQIFPFVLKCSCSCSLLKNKDLEQCLQKGLEWLIRRAGIIPSGPVWFCQGVYPWY